EELLDGLRCPDGFPESSSSVTKWKLKLRLRSHFSRGGTLETFVAKELEAFLRWQDTVYGADGMVLKMDEGLKTNTPELVYLLFLWYLIYASMGNLKTLWCF